MGSRGIQHSAILGPCLPASTRTLCPPPFQHLVFGFLKDRGRHSIAFVLGVFLAGTNARKSAHCSRGRRGGELESDGSSHYSGEQNRVHEIRNCLPSSREGENAWRVASYRKHKQTPNSVSIPVQSMSTFEVECGSRVES